MRLQARARVPANGLPVAADRPAFYALSPGTWHDYASLLHPPYTLWHLSYVVLGAALAPSVHYDRLGATLLAFFLAVGVSAHALDELAGRPLKTRIPQGVLVALGVSGLVGAMALGLTGAIIVSPWLLAFMAFGAFIAPAYNLEWFRGRFHSDLWFALAWGAFPFLTAYWITAGHFGLSAVFGTLAITSLSLAQRSLSSRVRAIRRQARFVEGRLVYDSGEGTDIDRSWLVAADERALKLLALMAPAFSIAVLVARG